jgi:hypothetical protein
VKPEARSTRVTTVGYGPLINVFVDGKCIGWITPSVTFAGNWFWFEHGKKPTGRAESKAAAITAMVASYDARNKEA